MGTYCERHIIGAIDKYMELARDETVLVKPIYTGNLVCSNTDCDEQGIYIVSYYPKE